MLAGEASPLYGQGLNLSSSGLYVCCNEYLPLSTLVQLHFVLPDDTPVSLVASVVRAIQTQHHREPNGMALQFVSYDRDAAEKITHFVLDPQQSMPFPALSEKSILASRQSMTN
jgi:hypothetical protein